MAKGIEIAQRYQKLLDQEEARLLHRLSSVLGDTPAHAIIANKYMVLAIMQEWWHGIEPIVQELERLGQQRRYPSVVKRTEAARRKRSKV